jgi:transposase
MPRFIEGEDRAQVSPFPERLDDYIAENNPVPLIEVCVEELDLEALGFQPCAPSATGRPAYHASTLMKICIYGYLNRIPSGRRLERECQRNVEMMWLTGHLAPDRKAICELARTMAKLPPACAETSS